MSRFFALSFLPCLTETADATPTRVNEFTFEMEYAVARKKDSLSSSIYLLVSEDSTRQCILLVENAFLQVNGTRTHA